jgi:hypothetical protein
MCYRAGGYSSMVVTIDNPGGRDVFLNLAENSRKKEFQSKADIYLRAGEGIMIVH